MTDDEYMKPPMKDRPKPKLKDIGLAKWLEDRLGFRPLGVERQAYGQDRHKPEHQQ